MELYFYPYKAGSRSCRELAQACNAKRIRHQGSRFVPRANRLVVNWGSGRPNVHLGVNVLNSPDAVNTAGNKLLAFRAMQEAGVSVPEFWTPDQFENQPINFPAIVRTQLRGSGGSGCYYIDDDNQQEIDDIKLIVRYIKKTAEYRIHVLRGQVVDVQQKRKRNEVEDANFQIRNHDNGWVFCRNHVDPPNDSVTVAAVDAVSALGLDFGAVDVIWNRYHGAYVLEVNTAPGMEATTLENYASRFRQIAEN